MTKKICHEVNLPVDKILLGSDIDAMTDEELSEAADVGISFDSAVDIAKESSDIILLENNLLVLEEGVLEGRRVFLKQPFQQIQ